MVEKDEAARVRAAKGDDEAAAARKAIGLSVLQDCCRRLRRAALHRLRLRADIFQISFRRARWTGVCGEDDAPTNKR